MKKKDEIGWDLTRSDEITGWDTSSGFDEISDGIRWDQMRFNEISAKNPRANTKVTKVKTRGHEAFLCDLVVAFVPYVVAPGFRLLLPQLLVHDDERAESMQIVRVPRAI